MSGALARLREHFDDPLFVQVGRKMVRTPLAEGLIGGMAVGMASQGLKVVAEIQFMGFLYPALDQIAKKKEKQSH